MVGMLNKTNLPKRLRATVFFKTHQVALVLVYGQFILIKPFKRFLRNFNKYLLFFFVLLEEEVNKFCCIFFSYLLYEPKQFLFFFPILLSNSLLGLIRQF